MSGLVGESHKAALQTLIDAYDRVDGMVSQGASGPADSELVVLSAPMGWGKTRVVQEFYAHLAARQTAGTEYWPAELVPDVDRAPTLKSRKKVVPAAFDVAAEAEMPFLWWGVSCQKRQDDRLANVVADDIGQLAAHFGPTLNRLEANSATRRAALGIARTLSAAAPFSDIPGILDGLENLRTSIRDVFRAQRDKPRDREELRRIDPSQSDGSLVETWVGAIGSLLRAARIPMVVVVDDAHWADPASIEFIDELLLRAPCLVAFTAWPDQLRIQETNDQPADAGSLVGRWADRTNLCDIAQPAAGAAVELAANTLKITTEHPLAVQLAERAQGNPLVLRLWAELPFVQQSAQGGNELAPEDLDELPTDANAEFQRRWRELPEIVQAVLAPAAHQGITFVPAVVAETLATAGIGELSDSAQALHDAEDPHWWIRELTADAHQFTEPILRDIAAGRLSELHGARQRRELNAAFVSTLARLKSSAEWQALTTTSRRALLAHHVALAEKGERGDTQLLIETYQDLADLQPESKTGWEEALSLINAALNLQEHPDPETTLALQLRKANLLQSAGRASDALPLYEQ
ncbi:MAG: AAA family ATPase, partial [Microthrixaceae bacterium]|nr:AAA family ATPase [Microthrixaceae bacterium]